MKLVKILQMYDQKKSINDVLMETSNNKFYDDVQSVYIVFKCTKIQEFVSSRMFQIMDKLKILKPSHDHDHVHKHSHGRAERKGTFARTNSNVVVQIPE